MKQLLATIDRFEGSKAVLILPDNQYLIIECNLLNDNAAEGDILAVEFSLNSKAGNKKRIKVRRLINQIFRKNQ